MNPKTTSHTMNSDTVTDPATDPTTPNTPANGLETMDSEQVSMEPQAKKALTDPALKTPSSPASPDQAAPPAPSAPASDGRTRRRKRTSFKVPDWKPRPVRALWESATDEDRERAHKTSMVMLEYWTAQLSKQEAAERLGLAPIRVWQLSQQAVCGMLAGLLTQPRDRYGKGADDGACGDGRSERRSRREHALEREVSRLKAKLVASERLIEVMRELPVIRAARPAKAPGPAASSSPKKKRGGKAKDGRASGKSRGRRSKAADR